MKSSVQEPKLTLSEVIERLETASGPSRELDESVLAVCGWRYDPEAFGIGAASRMWVAPDGEYYDAVIDPHRQFPRPTSSIDAALTLARADWKELRFIRHDGTGAFGCFLEGTDAVGATPAIALSAAALRRISGATNS